MRMDWLQHRFWSPGDNTPKKEPQALELAPPGQLPPVQKTPSIDWGQRQPPQPRPERS